MAKRFEDDSGVVVAPPETKKAQKTERPRMFVVLMHNDHYTTREFVVYVLETVFRHSESRAIEIMMHVHTRGVGVAGVYTREIAETKVATVERMAREMEYPLLLTMEPESGDEKS